MVRKLVRYFNLLQVGLVYIAEFLLVAMVLLIFANVVLRYVFNSGIIWSEETALLIAVWFSFIAMALGVKLRLHIHINVLSSARIPAKLDALLWKIRDVVVILVGAGMFWWGWILIGFTMKSILPATGLPAGVIYMVVPVAAIFIVFDGLMDLLGVDMEETVLDQFLGGTLSFHKLLSSQDGGSEKEAGPGGDHA